MDEHRSSSLPSPVDAAVKLLLQNAARDRQERPAGKSALEPRQLRRICRRSLKAERTIEVRDRAIFLVGFASGWRGSELVSLDLADVSFRRQGIVLFQAFSKTDQEGRGRVVGLHRGSRLETCPVDALRAWLKVRGDWPGPLFCQISKSGNVLRHPITRETVNHRLKAALKGVGDDPSTFGSHSLRVGNVTASSEAGATALHIMGRTGHKSITTVLGYIRPATVFLGRGAVVR